jgi:hypothetical protein
MEVVEIVCFRRLDLSGPGLFLAKRYFELENDAAFCMKGGKVFLSELSLTSQAERLC